VLLKLGADRNGLIHSRQLKTAQVLTAARRHPAAGRMADIEQVLLQQIADNGSIADSGDFAAELKEDHLKVVGVMKSLEMAEMVEVKVRHTIAPAYARSLGCRGAGVLR
jgi:hypothetical protein